MTDSILKFNFFDGCPMAVFYIKNDTNLSTFIPLLKRFCDDIDKEGIVNRNSILDWGIMSLSLASKIKEWCRPESIEFINIIDENKNNTAYRHIITPMRNIYTNHELPTSDVLNITTNAPSGETVFDNLILTKASSLSTKLFNFNFEDSHINESEG